jgi:hypothetical protein
MGRGISEGTPALSRTQFKTIIIDPVAMKQLTLLGPPTQQDDVFYTRRWHLNARAECRILEKSEPLITSSAMIEL